MAKQLSHQSSRHPDPHPIQRSAGVPGKTTLTEAMPWRGDGGEAAAVQAKGELGGDDAHRWASHGVSAASGPLPHLDRIQALFGRHDVSGVRAAVGGEAATASAALGAQAYATGDTVAFAQAPDLHLAAHEAAHVVQQRGGVRLSDGLGRAGDVYEQHADAVADRVVRGESAAALLDTMAHRGAAGGSAVQRAESSEPASATPAPAVTAPTGPSRVVPGGGGYTYQQFADGTIKIVGGPTSVGKVLAPDDPHNKLITDQIGPFVASPTPAAPGTAPAPPTTAPAPPTTAPAPPTTAPAPPAAATPNAAPVDPANHQSRATFVGPAVGENDKTTQILDTIWPYFHKDDLVISGFLTDAELIWKINFHWDEILWTCDKVSAMDVSAECKTGLAALASELMGYAPDPGKGAYIPSPKGVPVDKTSPAAFDARYNAVKSVKPRLQATLDAAGILAKYPKTDEPGRSFHNACDFVKPPSTSKHGLGYALDIKGDEARILAAAKRVGMTGSAKEAYTHVEFANGGHAPAAAPAGAAPPATAAK